MKVLTVAMMMRRHYLQFVCYMQPSVIKVGLSDSRNFILYLYGYLKLSVCQKNLHPALLSVCMLGDCR